MPPRRSTTAKIAPGQPGDTSIARYRARRDFSKTPEPAPSARPESDQHRFVVQKHAARRLHYDFRLELDGVLKSWAVTKGPSLDPADRRLAVRTEDHPIAYGDFEGIIPAGEYGGGTVMLWDQGRWEPLHDPHQGLAEGHLHFRLDGKRMRGEWSLVRMHGRDEKRENWLLIKGRDAEATPGKGTLLVEKGLSSVTTERTMDQIAAEQDRIWSSNRGGGAKAGRPAAAESAPRAPRRSERAPRAGKAKPGGAPLPDFVPPQLATLVERPPLGDKWLHEIKYDGYRTACRIDRGKITLLTRRGLDWTKRFTPLARAAAALPCETALLDGEVVVLGENGVSSFAALQQSLSESRADDLTYFLFDLLHLDGEDLRARPLEDRKAALAQLMAGLPADGPLRYSEHYFGRGEDFFRHACRMALEGTVSKRRDGPYISGRGKDWQKSKCLLRQEFVIGGYSRSAAAGRSLRSLLVGYYRDGKLIYAGKIGTGFSGAVADALYARLETLAQKQRPFAAVPSAAARGAVWVAPDIVCEVAFTAWTADGMIRHGAFQGVREDKVPADVTIERPAPPGDTEAEGSPAATPKKTAGKPSGTGARIAVPDNVLEMGGIRLSNPDKVLFPEQGLTKADLAAYYGKVALVMLPHVANRPLSLVRCPEGREAQCFFQRHYGPGLPAGIRPAPVAGSKGREDYLQIDSAVGLFALVQIGVLEIHPWGALADAPDKPDRIIFDFDPDPAVPWARVVAAAQECRDRLDRLGLISFVKTTGGKGLHVVVPIARRYGWPEVKAFAKALADQMAHDAPRDFVTTMSKAARKGRIFIDYLRNDLTSTAVGPYSSRARPGAPVAMPLDWDELPNVPSGSHFTVATIDARLGGDFEDPWAEMLTLRQAVTAKAKRALKLKD